MAVVKKKESSLHEKRNVLFGKIFLGIIAIMLSIFMLLHSKYLTALISMISGIIVIKKKWIDFKIINSGIKGEKIILKKLKKLDNSYIIYNDIQLFHRGNGAQVDHLVISPYGIFCIESKNLKGSVVGDGNSQLWTLKKTGKHGGHYEKEFYNPCKQSLGHSSVVKGILNEKGIYGVNVGNIVVFNEKNISSICVKNCSIPVIKSDVLVKEINKFKNRSKMINKEKVILIEKVINKKARK